MSPVPCVALSFPLWGYLHLGLGEQVAHAHAQAAAKGQERPSLLALLRQPPLWAELVRGQPALVSRLPCIVLQRVAKAEKYLPPLPCSHPVIGLLLPLLLLTEV